MAGLLLYLFTRLVALDKFPVYFFTDEAVQTMSAVDLISQNFRNNLGEVLPTYFENGGQYNLSLSVYLQLIPALLPRSVWLTRAVPAVISLVVPLCMGMALKRFFKNRLWWLAPLLFSVLPAWFLHSRTAFETSLGASMMALFLYFYLDYRLQNPKHLPLALAFGALAFYAYSPLQLVVVLAGFGLLIIDLRYHWQHKHDLLPAILLLFLLTLPYIRFRLTHPQALQDHLRILRSYWVSDLTLLQKMGAFASRYARAFNPIYWFFPDQGDLIRHQFKGWGHMPVFLLPLVLLGLAAAIKFRKGPACRIALVALFTAPAGAALADISITRLLTMLTPLTLLAAMGLEMVLEFFSKTKRLQKTLLWLTFEALAGFSLWLPWEAVRNGPTWYSDYGLYGLQWGGQELFDQIAAYKEENPEAVILLSPSWANGTDVIARFFMGDPLPIQLGTVEPYTLYKKDLDKNTLFVMTPEEYDWIQTTGKFQDIEVLKTLTYPNRDPGFRFVSLRYADDIDAILAQEAAERRKPQTATLTLLGKEVQASYSLLDINEIYQAFDGDEATLIRTFEANPLVIELTFTDPVQIERITALIGNTASQADLELVSPQGESSQHRVEIGAQDAIRPLTVDLAEAQSVQTLIFSLTSLNEGEPAHVHLWELILE